MDDKIFTIFGYLASANACLMMTPQVYLTIKKRSFEDVSIQMIYMNILTQSLFFPYSYHYKLYPLLTVNSALFICDIIIIFTYLHTTYRKKKPLQEADFMKTLLENPFIDGVNP